MVPQQNKPIIAVIGELNLSEGSTQYELAYKVGKLIAEDRFAIAFKDKKNLYGPLNKATRAHSGFSIVIATEELNSDENNLCDQLYIAKDSLDVLSTLYEIADMVIALPGGIGVLQSVSFFWVVQSVSDKDKPLILFGSQWGKLIEVLKINKNFESSDFKTTEILYSVQDLERSIKKLGDLPRV